MCEVCPAGKHSSICLLPIALIKYTFLLLVSSSKSPEVLEHCRSSWNGSLQNGNYAERGKYILSPFSHWLELEARREWGLTDGQRERMILEKIPLISESLFWCDFFHLHRVQLGSWRRLPDVHFSFRDSEIIVNIANMYWGLILRISMQLSKTGKTI